MVDSARSMSAAGGGSRPAGRPIRTAELLSVGSELTVGETRDTNAGDLGRELTGRGVRIGSIHAVPDDLGVVRDAFAAALGRADLVVSTGGLGPTPDDLTREAIAAAVGETPAVEPALEEWLRGLWARRGMPFPELNLKQAWLIPSARAIPNGNGTAPGWWVDRPDGRVVVALPGPPREMRPMWSDWVLPRLTERSLGEEVEIRTLRLAGIGESQAAERLGEEILRASNPSVATYARSDAVDVRIEARRDPGTGDGRGRSARELADEAETFVVERLGDHVWARGDIRWPDAVGEQLARLGWRLAIVETGTAGQVTALLGEAAGVARTESLGEESGRESGDGTRDGSLESLAVAAREAAGCQAAIAVRARPRAGDTAVSVAIASPGGVHRESRLAFLDGPQGRSRAALAAAAILLSELRRAAAPDADPVPAASPTEVSR